MMLKIAIGIATILTPTLVAAAADRSAAPPTPGILNESLIKYDIAGVRLGMTPEETRIAAAKAGYVIDRTMMSKSFEQLVLSELRERKPSVAHVPSSQEKTPREMWAKGQSGERLWLRFAPTPVGPQLMFANLSIDERRVTKVTFGEQVMSKYKDPSASHLSSMAHFWCAGGVPRCGADRVGADYPYLKYHFGPGGPALTLTDENRNRRAIEGAIAAEVDRRAPRGGASF